MVDVSIMIGNHKFNYRVSAIFRNGNKILLHHGLKSDHYTLPGGRVKDGETTKQALKREMEEEMGYNVSILRPVSFMENMFNLDDKDYHELLVTYEAQFGAEEAYQREKIVGIEEREDLEFIWKDISELENLVFKPEILIDVIKKNSKEFQHIINVENIRKEKSCGSLIVDNDKILLIKDNNDNWQFPKGHVEGNETEEQTAIRETKEETNLDIKVDTSKRYVNHYITDTNIDKTVILFKAEKIGGAEKPQESEIKKVQWVPIKEAIDKLTFDNSKEVLKQLLKDLK